MRTPLPANISNMLKRIPRLTASEERDLFRRVQRGDRHARERLVLSQLRFVIRLARNYRRHGCPLPDLIQEGTVGLLEAIKRFNPEKGGRLSTYAMWWIRAAMQDYVLRSGSIVRSVTTPQARTMYFNGKVTGLDAGNDVAVRSVAERFSTTMDEVRAFAQRIRMQDQALDAPLGDGPSLAETLPDTGADPETALVTKRERLDLLRRIKTAIPAMTRRERHILRRRFLGDKRLSRNVIGKELGLSKERVRQLEIRALEKLRGVGRLPQPAD